MISKFFIERPVLANVLAILMVLIGAVAVYDLPISQYPDVVPPTVAAKCANIGAIMNAATARISSTIANTYGQSSPNSGLVARCTTLNVCRRPRPLARTHSGSAAMHATQWRRG